MIGCVGESSWRGRQWMALMMPGAFWRLTSEFFVLFSIAFLIEDLWSEGFEFPSASTAAEGEMHDAGEFRDYFRDFGCEGVRSLVPFAAVMGVVFVFFVEFVAVAAAAAAAGPL